MDVAEIDDFNTNIIFSLKNSMDFPEIDGFDTMILICFWTKIFSLIFVHQL